MAEINLFPSHAPLDRRLPMTRLDNGLSDQLMTNLSCDVRQYYLDFKSPRRINSISLR